MMRLNTICALQCSLLLPVLFSQEFDPYLLFPHHEGDIWEYNFLNANYPLREQSQILSDSVSNGIVYFETIYRTLWDSSNYDVNYVIDTSYNVWRHDSAYYCCDAVLFYKLNTVPNEKWIIRDLGGFFEIGVFDSTYKGIFWGDSVTFAEFSFFVTDDTSNTEEWIWGTTHVLASDFGLVRTYAEGTGGKVLIGAVLDGIFWGDTTYVSTVDDIQMLPENIYLNNYPNPFNPTTTIQYELPLRSHVQITIYDLLGRKVTSLVSETQKAGFKSVQWNATNDHGKPVSAGVYLYQIQAGEYVQTRKMVLLK